MAASASLHLRSLKRRQEFAEETTGTKAALQTTQPQRREAPKGSACSLDPSDAEDFVCTKCFFDIVPMAISFDVNLESPHLDRKRRDVAIILLDIVDNAHARLAATQWLDGG